MPKMKTHSGAKKRFRRTATGKILARHAFTSHNLGKKDAKRKRRLGRPVEISEGDRDEVKRLLAGRGRKQ
jgi:large subunit ribosomal protein L35